MAGIKENLGWGLSKTWEAVKIARKQLTSSETSFIHSDSQSYLNLPDNKTHHHQLKIQQQYTKAAQLDETADKALTLMRQPANIDSLNLKPYADARAHAFDEVLKKMNKDAQSKADEITAPSLSDIFHLTRAQELLNQFKSDIGSSTIHGEIKPFSIANGLRDLKKDVTEALNEQFKVDKEDIKINYPDTFVQDKLLAALQEAHKSALEKSQLLINEQMKIQYNNARAENARLAFLHLMNEKGDAAIQEQLKALAAAHPTTVTATGKDPLANVNIKDIQPFKTLTGLMVTRPSEDSFEITIPGKSWLNTSYRNGLQDNVLADLTLLALAVKATGATSIEISLSGNNTEEIKLIAQKAVKANLEAGFSLGNGAKEKLDANGKSIETAKEKKEREGNMFFNINGNVMPLLSEKNAEGKVTKEGVFDSQEQLNTYVKETMAQAKTKRRGLENLQEWKPAEPAETVELKPMPNDDEGLEVRGGPSI